MTLGAVTNAVGLTSESHIPEFDPFNYKSNGLRLFIHTLDRQKDVQVLDTGPVCGENISFVARRTSKLYVCDLLHHMERCRKKGLPLKAAMEHLDYPAGSFDGILLWDLIDHLDNIDAGNLIEICQDLLKPKGLLMVCGQGGQAIMPQVYSFVLGEDFQVCFRPQSHLNFSRHERENRDILSMFSLFTPIKSFIYRNGLKEFVFQQFM